MTDVAPDEELTVPDLSSAVDDDSAEPDDAGCVDDPSVDELPDEES